jgi:acetoin utilization deacetylase AcuC-like enzyme
VASFKLTSADYLGMGEVIASLRLSTHFVFEGGYAIDKPGVNTANVLIGFEGF